MQSIVRQLALFFLAAQLGCAVIDPVDENKFAGCYDHSCLDVPHAVVGVPALASIATRSTHTCGLTAAGEAWCWGDNRFGQLGDGTDAPRVGPVKVAGNLRFTKIAVGTGFTCAVESSGPAYCWGLGTALGRAAPDFCGGAMGGANPIGCVKSPLLVGARRVISVAAGTRHACVVDEAGAAWCWGFNFLGEVGSTAYGETISAPRQVSGSHVFASIEAGDSFTCALTVTGSVWCWGSDGRFELGRDAPACNSVAGFVNYCSAVPVRANTSATFTMLSVGNSHSCALTAAGVAQCWGDNGQGQLGNGKFENPAAPLVAQNGMTFTTIGASGAATCGTPTNGASVCWGLNVFGKLGIGTRQDLSTTPLPISGGRRFTSFAGGDFHYCALTADGVAWCWGLGRDGQLGGAPLLP